MDIFLALPEGLFSVENKSCRLIFSPHLRC